VGAEARPEEEKYGGERGKAVTAATRTCLLQDRGWGVRGPARRGREANPLRAVFVPDRIAGKPHQRPSQARCGGYCAAVLRRALRGTTAYGRSGKAKFDSPGHKKALGT
jgi:hypothetical protein